MTAQAEQRPPGIPEDYEQVAILAPDGTTLVFWGKVRRQQTPDGRTKLTIDGFIPAEQ